jgi:hypothetical protein
MMELSWARAAVLVAVVLQQWSPATAPVDGPPPLYVRDPSWPSTALALDSTTAVAVTRDDEVFVANHGPPRVLVLSESNGTVLRTWGDDELDTPHGLRIAPQSAHRSLLPATLVGADAGWTTTGATAAITNAWPASAWEPALELADDGPSSGIYTTVPTHPGVRYVLQFEAFTESLELVEGVYVNAMAYVQPGEHLLITTMSQIENWRYPSARPTQAGVWTTVTLRFAAPTARTTVVLHGEGSATAWFRTPTLTVDGPMLWLADMGGGGSTPDAIGGGGDRVRFGHSIYAYDRQGTQLGVIGAAASGAAGALDLGAGTSFSPS